MENDQWKSKNMDENKRIVSLKVAQLARAKGFNDTCDHAYCYAINDGSYYLNHDHQFFVNDQLWEKHYSAPKREELHEWLRNKGVFIVIDVDQTLEPKFCYSISQYKDEGSIEWKNHDPSGTALFYKYEQALEEALEEGLKLI